MFSNTPPAGSRLKRGGASGRRAETSTASTRDSDLPYISPMSSYAYGSQDANLPKAPRLSETRVRLADAIQGRQAEADARLKAAEEQREREAMNRKDRVSMPPPSIVPTRSPSRAPSVQREREPSRPPSEPRAPSEDVATFMDLGMNDFDNLSTLSGPMDTSRSFRGYFGANQVVSSKVTENVEFDPVDGPDDDSDGRYSPPEIGRSEEIENSGKKTSSRTKTPRKSALQPLRSSSTSLNGTARETRSTVRNRKSTALDELDKEQIRTAQRTNRRRVQRDDGDKENDVVKTDLPRPSPRISASQRRHTRPEDQLRSEVRPEPAPRREKFTPANIDVEPRFSEQPLDWLFWQWNESLGWRVKWLLTILSLVLVTMFLYEGVRAYGPGMKLPGIAEWSRRPYTYQPPTSPPKDLHELADRLHGFEKALGKVDEALARRVDKEVNILKGAVKEFEAKLATTSSKSNADAIASASRLEELKKRLENTEERAAEYKKILSPETISRIHARLAQLEPEKLQHEIRSQFRKALPASMVAHVKEDGTLDFMPDFKRALNDFFEEYLPNALTRHSPKIVTPNSSKGAPSWESFMKANKDRLRSTIDSSVDSRVNEAVKPLEEAILSKDSVMMLVEDRIGSFVDQFDARMNSHDSKLSQHASETDRKLAATTVQLEQAVASLTAKFNRLSSSHGSAPVSSRPVTSTGNMPVPYNVNLPDFANRLSGAYVYPYLTSPSYEPSAQRHSWLGSLIAPAIGQTSRISHPVTALLSSADIGDCWAFPGSEGTLAIKLATKIYPTHVTIEHGYKHHLPDVSSAPKEFSFWAKIDNVTERATIERASLHASGISTYGGAQASDRSIAGGKNGSKRYEEWVKVGDWMYDVDSGEIAQTWELPVDFRELGVKVRTVAFRIEGNYGNDQLTCLYRVKVHGLRAEGNGGDKASSTTTTATGGMQKEKSAAGWFGTN